MHPRIRVVATLSALTLAAGPLMIATAPTAAAAPDVSGVTMSADGFSVTLDSSVQMWDGQSQSDPVYYTRDGAQQTFGNGSLTAHYGARSDANAYFLSRGGYVKKTGGTCGADGKYYQRTRVTLTGLTAGAKDVWAFWDGDTGVNNVWTSQWEDAQFARPSATGTSGQTSVTVSSATGISIGQYVYGTGIGAGAAVTGISGTTVTLSAANAGAVSGTVNFGARDATVANLDRLCNGTDYFVENVSTNGGVAGAAVIDLGTNPGAGVFFNDAAGLQIDGTTATSVSFDVYVPTAGHNSGWQSLSLGFIVDVDGAGLDAASDYGIQTQVYARPWNEGWADVMDVSLLAACGGGVAAADAPCLGGTASDNGVFLADGATRVGTASDYSVQLETFSMSQGPLSMTGINVKVGLTGAAGASTGFEVPAGSIVKFVISLPTSGTLNGINFGAANFLQAAGQTAMKVDPADSDHSWALATTSGRTSFTFRGEATTTSRAVSKLTWTDSCNIDISGSTVSASGCNVDANHIAVDTVPTTAGINYQNNPIMQTIGGGFVSTNAQGTSFGEETMLGQSFQFAVAGPSTKEDGSSRATDGYYYVCVPAAFLAGSFGTTPAAAAASWQGTRDGAVISSGVGFAAGTCGVGAGLVASYPQFGYSAPLFSVKPPAAAPSNESSSSSSSATTTTTTTTPTATSTAAPSTAAPVTPVAAPVVYPTLSTGNSVAPSYLLKLADWTPSKNSTISISVPRMYRSACMVDDEGRVVAKKAGLCGVRIKVVSPQGKTFYKRVYLTTA